MKYPFRCPVCNGSKSVPLGFYTHTISSGSTSMMPVLEACRSCDNGILWVEYEGFTKAEIAKIQKNKKFMTKLKHSYKESRKVWPSC